MALDAFRLSVVTELVVVRGASDRAGTFPEEIFGLLAADGVFRALGAVVTSGSGTSSRARSSKSSSVSSSSEERPEIPERAEDAPPLPGPPVPDFRKRESITVRIENLSESLKTFGVLDDGTPAKTLRSK